jgi:uncharacterized membrane protein
MTARVSLLGRCLEPLAAGLWIIFLIWTAFIAVVWSCGIGQGGLGAIGNRDLRAALEWLIGIGDVLWITLAAANVHLWLAEAEGLATARRWALLVIGSAVALALLSALSGFPLGTIVYSRQLGVQLGPIPFGLPLLWFAIFISARQLVLRVWPRISQAGLAAAVGALALLTDLNLESVAAKARGWWLWKASTPATPPLFQAPWTNYVAWSLMLALLAFFLRSERVGASRRVTALRPIAVLLLLYAVFLAANIGRWMRG